MNGMISNRVRRTSGAYLTGVVLICATAMSANCSSPSDAQGSGTASTGSSEGGATASGSTGSAGSGGASNSSTGSSSGGGGGAAGCVPDYVAANPAPIGWASLNGGTTGGGSATPTIVTTLPEFNQAATGPTPRVIYVNGNLKPGIATIGSNKTIIGCSGTNATLNGHLDLKASTNVIVRNLHIVGYNCAPPDVDTANGGKCEDGLDAVTIEISKNIWFDHNAISDGTDGNLDVTYGSDFITISYTKFFYSTQRSDPNDTGAKGHRFSNLVGSSDLLVAEDSGHLNITWHHNWWGQYVVSRQPRVRFGKNHVFNNLWMSNGNDYCIGVGVGASIRSENNAFIDVTTPIDTTSFSDSMSSAKSTGNLYSGTTGATPADLNAGSVFTPPYTYTLEAASAVEADVQANAGPK